jgi:hypothetical protein
MQRLIQLFFIFISLTSCVIGPYPASPPRTALATVTTVAQWGGTPADASRAKRHVPTRITLHHQGEAFPPNRDPHEYLRALQSWSRSEKKWIDIPYHYIIDLSGINFAGDTNTAYDPTGHALIEVVGNYQETLPSQAQLDAVVRTMAMLAVKYHISPEQIAGHRDFADTECPGKNLYRYLENGYLRERVALALKK